MGLFVAVACILINGFFVAAEFALVKVRATQFHSRARKGEKKAIVAARIVERLDRYLSVSQLGITVASLGLGWVGEPALAAIVDNAAVRIVGHELSNGTHIAIDVVALGLLTFVHLLLGELVPKFIAIQRSESTVLFAAWPLQIFFFTFRPILFVLEKSSSAILRMMGFSADAMSEGKLSEEEILGILAVNAAHSRQGKEKRDLFERVLRFSQRTARHSMVPRVDVFSIPVETGGEETYELVKTHQYSRVPLTKGRALDDVVGYLYAKDFLLHSDLRKLPNLNSVRRDILFVPETRNAVDVLRDMQRRHVPMAVVVDEYGGTSGLVTMEDLLEEIVGEIRDEFDEEPQKVIKAKDEERAWDIDGRASMEDLRPIGIVVDEAEILEPVGVVVVERLGRIPRPGDRVTIGNATAEVIGVSRRRVTRIRVRLADTSLTPLPVA